MNKFFAFKLAPVLVALLALPAAHAGTLSRADYDATKARIAGDAKGDRATCSSFAANAKDICVEEAKAREAVAKAELELAYTGKDTDRHESPVRGFSQARVRQILIAAGVG